MTAVLEIQGRGRTAFCRLVSSRGLGSPPAGPYGGPGRLRTLVVRMLLERDDVNPNTADTEHGRTPLSWAAENGHEGVVRILLERNDVNPDTADTEYNRTPLWWAAKNGYEEVVRMLLERNDVGPNHLSQTPLLWAASNGHEGVVRMLLERNDVNPNSADTKHGRTPLSWAAENGNERIAKLLREAMYLGLKYAAGLQPTDFFSPEPPEPSEPPFKRARRV